MGMYDHKSAIHYYEASIKETNHPYYWYGLADTQARAGYSEEALQTIDRALQHPLPYPSTEQLLQMRQYLLLELKRTREMNQNNVTIVSKKQGDVDGDKLIDTIFLLANKTPNSPFWKQIRIVIQNGQTQQLIQIPLKNNQGYDPTIFLGDFTGNNVDDLLVVINSGGSGGIIYAYIYSYVNGRFKEIFNDEAFNEAFKYDVTYENEYKASVISKALNKKFMIDLTYKGNDYLTDIYTNRGILKSPINGWVNPLSGLYPVDFNRDGTYELLAYQRIAGRYNADSLGYVETILKWNEERFVTDRQNIAIEGKEL